MAIPSYVGAELTKDLNTFEDWFNRTNSITTDLGSRVVHAQANSAGGVTTGNASIIGIFSANTIAVADELRGGPVGNTEVLLISSDIYMNGGEDITSNTVNHIHQSNTYVITSNTITTSGNIYAINHTNLNINATTSNFGGTTLNINVDDLNISSNTTFNANSVTMGSLSVTPSTFNIANNTSVNINTLSFNVDDSAFNITANTNLNANTIFNANTIINGTSLDINANTDVGGTSLNITANTTITTTSLDITSAIAIEGDTVANGDITAIDFNATSDITLKENIEPISNGLEVISQMNPVSFNWKQSGDRAYGFIAQEIEEILPDIISESDGIKSISYIQIISFLVDAIKKQEDRIRRLEERL